MDVTLRDDDGGSDADSTTVNVTNEDPVVDAGSDQDGEVSDTISANATFTDLGTVDTHTATIDWDDGTVDTCPGDCDLTEPSSDGTVTGSHEYLTEGTLSVTVTVTDNAGASGTDTFQANIGRPGAPTLISPVDETAPADPTFSWNGASLSDDYRLQISTDTFATIDRNIGFAVLSNLGDGLQSDTLSNMGGADLDAATLYEWRVRARSVAGLTGDYSTTASFVTEGNPVAVTLEVDLEAPGTADDPVEFTVKLYAKDAFNPTSSTPWDLFGEIPVVPEFAGITGSRAGQTITITLPDTVAVGFYDITIQANHTLVNVKDNVGVATNTGTIVMGTLLEGNAIDDDPATEPGSVINALDASLLAVAINEGTDDPAVDFTRNGTVDLDDLDLLKANYLRFSPIPV